MVMEAEKESSLSKLALSGLLGGMAYLGLKPLLDGNPNEMHSTTAGDIVTHDLFPIVDAIPWPIVAAGVCGYALFREVTKRIPSKVSMPPLKEGSWKVPIGKTYRGKWVYFDFGGEVPHCIFCGSTKFGKTAFIKLVQYVLCHQISPNNLQILIIDLKGGASFADWLNVPHVLDVKYKPEDAEKALEEAEGIMWDRLAQIREAKLRRKPLPVFPHLFVVIDEGMVLADSEKAMRHLLRIASIGRESKVHLVYGTQRPSHEILPVTTRDQMEGRFVFHLNERGSSEVVLGSYEAHEMQARPGRMIHRSPSGDVQLQAAYIEDEILTDWLYSFADSHPPGHVDPPPDKEVNVGGSETTSGHGKVLEFVRRE